MASESELKVVFNFYEKITPPPKFSTFSEGWRHFGDFIETLDHYVGSQLHKNADARGLFPYVNFATFKGPVERIVKDMTEPTQELVQALIEGHGLPGHQINHPGGYIELATNNNLPLAPDLPARMGSTFIVMAYQTVETDECDTADFEANWADHCGLNEIQQYLSKNEKNLGRYGIYKRFTPLRPFHSFAYVFRCELVDVDREDSNLSQLVDKLQKLETPKGFTRVDTGVYFVEHVSPK
ncbi:uncharacterized protein [Apostichopus japonicus]|uniref:uncharacterized protein isoform X2 n=1 Tax=Stichopus japonicus TaxID=307972 RepID=UPI003AB89573